MKMNKSLSIVLLVIIVLVDSLSAHGVHKCIYDKINKYSPEEVAKREWDIKFNSRLGVRDSNQGYGLLLNETDPIRIQLYTDSLLAANDVGFSCQAAGDVITVDGSSYTCLSEDVLSSPVRTYLIDTLLKKAKTIIESTLYVERLLSPIQVGQCNNIAVPGSYQTPGVSADIVVLVTARPIAESGVLAYGRDCSSLSQRSILGQLNFDPKSVSLEESVYNFQFGVAIHELSHVLGFSAGRFPANIKTAYTKNITADGSSFTAYKITSPNVVNYVKSHFGCDTLDGAELEDQGGSGTEQSHWEKRIFNNEYMTGTASHYPIFSNLTLALFADLGYYAVNYQYAQTLVWGNGLGCGFATSKCTTWDNNLLYCEDSSAGDQCTYDRVAKGTCSVRSLSVEAKYQWIPGQAGDQLPDFCPAYDGYSNAYCVDNTIPDKDKDLISTGEVFGASSRCFTSSLLKNVPVSLKSQPTCFPSACQANGKLKVKVSSFWYDCPYGETVEVEGFAGKLTCPTGNELCINAPTDNEWPIFTSIEPESAEPGDTITIIGENFNNSTYIEIDDLRCDDTVIYNSTFLTAVLSTEYVDFTSVLIEKEVDVFVVNSNTGKNDVGQDALNFRIPLNEAYIKRVGNWLKTHWYVAVIGGLVLIGAIVFIWRCCCSNRKNNAFSRKSNRLSTR